jgi:hypothetical protein
MAAACTALSSSTFAGQTVFKAPTELKKRVGDVESRVVMRRTAKSTPDSLWYVFLTKLKSI